VGKKTKNKNKDKAKEKNSEKVLTGMLKK